MLGWLLNLRRRRVRILVAVQRWRSHVDNGFRNLVVLGIDEEVVVLWGGDCWDCFDSGAEGGRVNQAHRCGFSDGHPKDDRHQRPSRSLILHVSIRVSVFG